MRLALNVLGAVLVAAVLGYAFAHPPAATVRGKIDLDAFYCAGKTYLMGNDPYRYGAMHACETANLAPKVRQAAVPAPFPPYAVLAFALIAKLPFADAALLWELLLIVSAFAIIVVIVDLTGLPMWLVGTATLVPILAQTVVYGSLAPIPIALLCCAAIAIHKERWPLASICLGVSTLEPHLALPPLIAALILLPKIRWGLLCVIAALLVLTLVAGLPLSLEYFARVLPAHAVSELGTAGQFSLSALLYELRVPAQVALAAGSAQYVLFAILSIVAARAVRGTVPAAAIVIPMAFATIGGTFVHASQLLALAPLAWIIVSKMRSTLAWAGLVLVLVPWDFVVQNAPPSSVVAGIVLFVILAYRANMVAAAAGAITLTALLWLAPARQTSEALHSIGAVSVNALTEVAWAQLASQTPPTLATQIAHALTYLGIVLLFYAGYEQVSRYRRA